MIVKLSEIAREFNLTEIEVHKAILRHSNEIKSVLMNHSDGDGYIVPIGVYSDLVEARDYFLGTIIDVDSLNHGTDITITRGSYVYFLFNGGVLVYIGQSKFLLKRITNHMDDKEFDSVGYIGVKAEDRIMVEAVNIREYKPKYNIQIIPDYEWFIGILRKCDFSDIKTGG